MLADVSLAPTDRPLGELPSPRPPAQQHLGPQVLKALEQYSDAGLDKEYQKQSWEQYWGNPNGATTDGVLHLAYCPDGPAAGAHGLPLNFVHPDIVRAEYECIEAVVDWMIGKSRCLQYLRAIRFERCLPTLVTDTNRSTFDLYVEGGPFFNVPLDLVRGLRRLEPIIALIDTTADSPNRFPPAFAESAIPNVYAVLATSGNIEDSYALSKRVKPVLFYPLDLWPDNELYALDRLLCSSSDWFASPHQLLHPLNRPQSGTHLPPRSSIIQPLSNTEDATPATPPLRLRMINSLYPAQPPPSRFLPLVANEPFFASRPPHIVGDSARSSARHYTFFEAVELLGRIVRDPIDLVYRRQIVKSVPPSLKLCDLIEDEGRFVAALDLVVEEVSRSSSTRFISRLSSCSKSPFFDKMFFQVPVPGVARPTYNYPRMTIVAASPAWAAWIRTRLWSPATPHPRTALALSAILP